MADQELIRRLQERAREIANVASEEYEWGVLDGLHEAIAIAGGPENELEEGS